MYEAPVRPAAPMVVKIAAGVVAALAVVNLFRIGVQVPLTLADDKWSSGAKSAFLVLNVIAALFSIFMLVLAQALWRGRMWAWVTLIVLVSLAIPVGAIFLLPQLIAGEFPWVGLAIVVPSLGLLLALTVPPSARRYILRKPAQPVAY
ncbi:hypothetical protein [Actinoplanes sp. GCM10030250]|uniref:hypothetical protein n=1 Tax=Actinoplanes sp. GCM10030250 TaxID=3273376 RepID=UPI003622622E